MYLDGVADFQSLKEVDKYGNHSLKVILEGDDLFKFEHSGSQLSVKRDEEGKASVVFRRPPSRLTRDKKLLEFGPPKIYDKHGAPTNRYVQKGDRVTVKLSLYDTEKGVGTVLESVILLDKEGNFVPRVEDVEYKGVRV